MQKRLKARIENELKRKKREERDRQNDENEGLTQRSNKENNMRMQDRLKTGIENEQEEEISRKKE